MRKFRIWFALAKAVLLESLRRKDLWVVAILGFLIMMASGALGFFGASGMEMFAKDLAVTVLSGFSAIAAIVTTARLIPDEIKNRTLYPLLARPITRFDLMLGKLMGAVMVTWIAFLMLAALTALALASFHVVFEPIMLQYLVAKMLGLVVLCAVTLTLSIYMTPQAAATLSFVLAFGSSMIVRAFVIAYNTSAPSTQWIFKVFNAILPQYGLFDLGGRAANIGWSPVPLWVMGALTLYALIYSSSMLGLSYAKFRKQAV